MDFAQAPDRADDLQQGQQCGAEHWAASGADDSLDPVDIGQEVSSKGV